MEGLERVLKQMTHWGNCSSPLSNKVNPQSKKLSLYYLLASAILFSAIENLTLQNIALSAQLLTSAVHSAILTHTTLH